MELGAIRTLYDRDERRETREPLMRREVAPGVVRLVDVVTRNSMVIYSSLDAANADAAIRREVAYFDALGHQVEWKLYQHDGPPDMASRLRSHGFLPEDPEAIMVLELDEAPDQLLGPIPSCVRRLKEPDQWRDLIEVHQAV